MNNKCELCLKEISSKYDKYYINNKNVCLDCYRDNAHHMASPQQANIAYYMSKLEETQKAICEIQDTEQAIRYSMMLYWLRLALKLGVNQAIDEFISTVSTAAMSVKRKEIKTNEKKR